MIFITVWYITSLSQIVNKFEQQICIVTNFQKENKKEKGDIFLIIFLFKVSHAVVGNEF